MPASGRSEAEAASRTREVAGATRRLPEGLRSLAGVGRRAKRRRPTRLGRREVRCRAVRGGTQRGSRETAVGDVSTTASGASEERNERTAVSRLGLWNSSPQIRQYLFINERLGLWRCPSSIRSQLFINERVGLWRCSLSIRSQVLLINHHQGRHPSQKKPRIEPNRFTTAPVTHVNGDVRRVWGVREPPVPV